MFHFISNTFQFQGQLHQLWKLKYQINDMSKKRFKSQTETALKLKIRIKKKIALETEKNQTLNCKIHF